VGWLQRLLGDRLPEGFTGTLEPHEHVLAAAGPLVATSHGLWLSSDDGHRRVDWHLVSKAAWADDELCIVEAEVVERAGDAELIVDQAPQRFALPQPGKLPVVVRERVDGSIVSRYHQDLPEGGGAWFVQRKTPGGIVLQARADPGSDPALVAEIAREAAAKLVRE
jgi:hypothetical protein